MTRKYINACQVFPRDRYTLEDIEEAIQEAFTHVRVDGVVIVRLPDGGLITSYQKPYVPY